MTSYMENILGGDFGRLKIKRMRTLQSCVIEVHKFDTSLLTNNFQFLAASFWQKAQCCMLLILTVIWRTIFSEYPTTKLMAFALRPPLLFIKIVDQTVTLS